LDVLSDAGIELSVGKSLARCERHSPYLYQHTPTCRTLGSAKKFCEDVKLATPVSLDVADEIALDAAVAQHDLVLSLIPYRFHATVIKSAIRNKKNVVTTSYKSPAMLAPEQEIKEAGITVVNEIGVICKNCKFLSKRKVLIR